MTHNVQLSESLNERGNRSYTSNFVFPKTGETGSSKLYVVCATVGPGVMYRGEQVAEQVVTQFTNYINTNSPTTLSEADDQAEMIAHALIHTEAALSEYNILHPECNGITATLACIHFTENGAIVGWVGDTRAVLMRGGMLIKQTNDHSTKYPYDDFSMHPRRSVTRVIEGSDKPTTIDVEWWNDLQPNDIIVLGTYAIMRPLEQGFLGDAWERDEMRHAIKLACDAHARDNYAITTIRMGEATATTNAVHDAAPFMLAAAAPIFVTNEEEPTLESETSPIVLEDDEPTLESETAPLAFANEAPTLESETAAIVLTEPDFESETAPLPLETEDMVEIPVAEATEETDEDEVTSETEEEPIVEEVIAEVETPAVVTEPTPIIGNYTYEEEEETPTIAWTPTLTKEEISTPIIPIVTPITTTTSTIMDNINQTTTNTTNTVRETTENIVDFTPISDRNKGNTTTTTTSTTTVREGSGKSGISSWGWLAAAAMLFIALAVWFGSQMFGRVDDELSAQLANNMQTELANAETPADKLAVYEMYKTKATEQYKGKINEVTLKSIEEGMNETSQMMAQADITATDMNGTAATTPATTATTEPAAPKEAVTEAGVKTKTATAAMPSVPVTESGALTTAPKAKIAKAKVTAPKAEARMGRPAAGAKVVAGVNTVKQDPLKAYDKVWNESEGFRVVSKGGKWGWAKADGTSLIAPIYEECGSFHNGMAAVKKGGKWGFTNTAGKLVIGYKYKSITAFGAKCPGLAQVNDGAKMIFVDAAGKEAKGCN
jgi:serine/threonine protein phosphatase PrpC